MKTLRPGWFQEFSPRDQELFDFVRAIITKNHQIAGYQHIFTPAVEFIDTLKKWGDEVAKQIFGLFGLAQWPTDPKDYALHFDLTVPFARYVLDHQNELAFPFKRQQIQPVRRGERSQRGRFKEFFQADIDAIRKSEKKSWENLQKKPQKNPDDEMFDVFEPESLILIARALDQILEKLKIPHKISLRRNHRQFATATAQQNFKLDEPQPLFDLFDKFYKIPSDEFQKNLEKIAGPHAHEILEKLKTPFKNPTLRPAPEFEKLKKLHKTFSTQNFKNLEILFDPFIVRGLDYYTGLVFEWFFADRFERGSIAGGGGYAHITEFLDPRQSFSGVGGSIGLSRLVTLLLDEFSPTLPQTPKILILKKIDDSPEKSTEILEKLHAAEILAEIFPTPAKLEKQFKFAEKKWLTHTLELFPTELVLKNLETQEKSKFSPSEISTLAESLQK